MRRLIQKLLLRPILWATRKFASRPNKERIFPALTDLLNNIREHPGKKGITLNLKKNGRFIVFSDQHKGARNGADDFTLAEPNYLSALAYYYQNKFQFISLGDCEELWENLLGTVKRHNAATFEAEKKFIDQNGFFKVFGNHDLYWANDPLAWIQIKNIYGKKLKVFEGIVLRRINDTKYEEKDTTENPVINRNDELTIFMTHGHQGDASSDGNWFSKFFVSRIWAPLQAYLRINPNTPAYDESQKTIHNNIMYEWSAAQRDLLLITGHTHQPVFESLTHLERILRDLTIAKQKDAKEEVDKIVGELTSRNKLSMAGIPGFDKMKPSYFNSGCCCFSDGDCTGIEITYEKIALIKWSSNSGREVLEERSFNELMPFL